MENDKKRTGTGAHPYISLVPPSISKPLDTPVFLPGESQGHQSLVGCHLWGHTESDTTEAT